MYSAHDSSQDKIKQIVDLDRKNLAKSQCMCIEVFDYQYDK